MPFDGSGNFSRSFNWQQDRDNGINILASRMDGEFNNFAGGMNVVFFRNGLVPMSGALNMGQNPLLGLAAGSLGALGLRFGDDSTSGLFLNGVGRPTLVAGGAARLEANTTGVAVTGGLAVAGTLNATAVQNGGNQVWHAGNFVPGNYAALSGAVFTGAVSAPTFALDGFANFGKPTATLVDVSFDSADVLRFARTSNQFDFIIGGFSVAAITSGGVTVPGTLNATTLQNSGNQVWHAGNFVPGSYAALSGAAFSGNVSGPNFYTPATAGTFGEAGSGNGVAVYGSTGVGGANINAVGISAGGAERFRVTSTGVNTTVTLQENGNFVWHAGNFAPSAFAALAGANFSGAIQQSGNQVWHAGNLASPAQTTGITMTADITRSGGGAYAYQDTSGRSAKISRGTAAPSGGSDGDIYFQYT